MEKQTATAMAPPPACLCQVPLAGPTPGPAFDSHTLLPVGVVAKGTWLCRSLRLKSSHLFFLDPPLDCPKGTCCTGDPPTHQRSQYPLNPLPSEPLCLSVD